MHAHADVEAAGALSAAVIAFGSLAGIGVTLLARHPTFEDQPVIDFDLAIILLPVVLLGVSVGANLEPPFACMPQIPCRVPA